MKATRGRTLWNSKVAEVAALASFVLAVLVLSAGCQNDSTFLGETLPGRSRPEVRPDWPHPRDFSFPSSEFQPPDPEQSLIRTDIGIRSYVLPDPADPLVRITAVLPLGRLHEREGEAGASHVLTMVLIQGGSDSSVRALSSRLDALGAELTVEEMLDATRISLEVLAGDWREGLALMLDRLHGTDPDDGILRDYRTGNGYGSPTAGVGGDGFRPEVELERILGGYPLAPPDPGLPVDPAAVRALASRSMAPGSIVLGVGGAVTKSQVEEALVAHTRGWQAEGRDSGEVQRVEGAHPSESIYTVEVPSLEGWVAMGKAVGAPDESERAPLAVATDVLNTRLNIATREVRGLSNRTIFVLPETANGAGLMRVRTGGRPEAVAPLIQFSGDEMRRLASGDDPITEDEIRMAKGALILGEWQKSLGSARQTSTTYALETVRYGDTSRLMGWPAAVRAVTGEDAARVAQKYLDPEDLITVVVGPIDKIRQARHPRWPVDFDALGPSVRLAR